jgi:hypothetical protein
VTTTSDQLQRLAARVAPSLAPDGQCVILCGSAAAPWADRASDIDLYVFTDSSERDGHDWQPPLDNAAKVFADRSQRGGWFSRWSLSGVVMDVEWVPRSFVDRVLGDVVRCNDVDPEKQQTIRGLIDCQVLSGRSVHAAWLEAICPYPDALAVAMVRRHLRLRDLVRIRARTLDRGDTLAFYAQASAVMLDLVGMLAGVNRYYLGVSPDRAKWLPLHLNRMPCKPPNMTVRVDRGLRKPSEDNLADLNCLGEEVLTIVEGAFPQLWTRHVRSLV